MSKVLVTGSNGFIGSNLCKRLIDEGHEVSALVRKSSNLHFLEGVPVNLVYGDITEPETLPKALEGMEKVFHVAGLAADWGPYELFEKVNFQGTKNVATAASKAGVKRLIYISTVAFYGFGKRNVTEEFPPANNLIPYAQTKYLAEQWLWEFRKNTAMEITAVQPGNVFGANDHTFISKYIDALLTGKFAEVNHGKSKTCPVFVDNLVDIILMVANQPGADGNAYIATDGLEITWHEFNSVLAGKLGVKLPKTSLPYWLAMSAARSFYTVHQFLKIKKEPFLTPYRINNGGKDYHFSIQKLKNQFQYTPGTDLNTALQKTVDWYKASAKN
ncbi:MAG: NAD-dependent epimerase/dehydratase family protein [Bacteroidales bacterium]|nr:NAD-dependent epimerase/dehydratase family protein [Bacteroidales bacterium]